MSKWQQTLYYYSVVAGRGSKTPMMKLYPEKTLEEVAEDDMKNRYPGNYCVEEYFDSKIGKFSLRLKFENEAEETWWLLKYS